MRNGSHCRSCFTTRPSNMFRPLIGQPLPRLTSPLSRRAFTLAGGALALSGIIRPASLAAQGGQGGGPARLEIIPGGTHAIPIAVTNFVAVSPAPREGGAHPSSLLTQHP